MINFYQILELPDNAGTGEIKSAFRRLSFKYHPDISREENSEEMFKRVNEAYQVLSDPLLRKIYDERFQKEFKAYNFVQSRFKYNYLKEKIAYRNAIFIFLFFIVTFIILEVSPSISSVQTANEYKANLNKKAWESFLNSQERNKQIDVISRRTNQLVEMFRKIPQK